jgi:hypothetical protein
MEKKIVLLIFLWLFICFPLFGERFIPTHDGEYHIIRIHEFSKMLKEGHIFPRWAPGLNSGYGFPLFIFHYPFPNYIGSFFHLLGFSLPRSFQMSLALGVFVGMIGCYVFLKKEFKHRFSAFFGTILFLTVPYLYVDIYIRGSIGEIWAIAWMFVSFTALVWQRNVLLGISIGCLILSHNILAMIFLPLIGAYSFLYYRRQLLYIIAGVFVSSYFWIPAIFERQYVIGLNSVTYKDHFPELAQLLIPSWGSNFSQPGMAQGEMSQQIGIIPLGIISLSVIAVIKNKKRNSRENFFLFVTLFGLFFMLPVSDVFWEMMPFLQYIQYPWRILSLLLLTVPSLGAIVVARIHTYLMTAIIVFACILVFSYMKPVTYEPRDDAYYLSRKEFTDGTSSLGNSFSTIWTPWIKERSSEVVSGSGLISSIKTTSTSVSFVVSTQQNTKVRIHRTYYPGWQVWINDREIPIDFSEGVLDIEIPKGTHQVFAVFTETTTRQVANAISVIALCSLVALSILNRHYARSN